MKYIDFQKQLLPFRIFSTNDIRKKAPNFDSRRLNEWQRKNYIQKIINRWYYFSQIEVSEQTLFLMANSIYSPSYISFESALAWYGMIPEGVFSITSTTSRKSKTFKTQQGIFFFHSLKSSLFFGYRLEKWENRLFKMATPEKALLDYMYLHPRLKKGDDFEAWRINTDWINTELDKEKLKLYLSLFSKKALSKRVGALLKYANDA